MSDALRPQFLRDYVGQSALVNRLGILIAAAKYRHETVPHLLLSGPPGLGKTTLAYILANEMNANCHVIIGPTLEKPQQIVAALALLGAGDVLFIDEIHSASKAALECLYPAMEDGVVGIQIDASTVQVQLPRFTLVAATTQPGLLDGPLRDRFNILAMNYYTSAEMGIILTTNAAKLCIECEPGALELLASRARGTPRVGNHLLRFARDVATVETVRAYPNNGQPIRLTVELAERALAMQGIDKLGLNEQDRSYLRVVIQGYKGGPVGADALAATMGLKTDTIAGIIEPWLLQTGLIVRTQRGRKSTEAADRHLAAATVF